MKQLQGRDNEDISAAITISEGVIEFNGYASDQLYVLRGYGNFGDGDLWMEKSHLE